MSWFSELTTKAEALLVKLDQGASQALHQSDESRSHEFEALPQFRDQDELESQLRPESETDKLQIDRLDKPDDTSSLDIPIQPVDIESNRGTLNERLSNQNQRSENNLEALEVPASFQAPIEAEIPSNSRKFPIQSRKSNSRPFQVQNSPLSYTNPGKNQTRDRYDRTTRGDMRADYIGADDIRANINRSLQEYASQSFSERKQISSTQPNQSNSNSHYDDEMVIIQNNPRPLSTSSSFNIDVPDDRLHISNSEPSEYLASRLLKQSNAKNNYSFYIHQVIDRLAHPSNRNRSTGPLLALSDETKIRLRRAQLRASSYARRLNYNFRTNPTVSSTTDSLASEVNRQQQQQDNRPESFSERNLNDG